MSAVRNTLILLGLLKIFQFSEGLFLQQYLITDLVYSSLAFNSITYLAPNIVISFLLGALAFLMIDSKRRIAWVWLFGIGTGVLMSYLYLSPMNYSPDFAWPHRFTLQVQYLTVAVFAPAGGYFAKAIIGKRRPNKPLESDRRSAHASPPAPQGRRYVPKAQTPSLTITTF